MTTISGITSFIHVYSSTQGDAAHAGIMSCSRGSTVVKDCIFAGIMEGEGAINSSGIVGWTNGVTMIENCLQIGDIQLDPSGSRTIARIPELVHIANSYYKTPFGGIDGVQITEEQLANGEVCYLLNKGNTENPTWFQTLGEDLFPVPNPSHQVVGKAADGTYTNDPSLFVPETPEPVETTPKTDLLDVVFNEDGTAEDISPMHNEVVRFGETASTYYSETFQRYVASFNNNYGSNASSFYKAAPYDNNYEIRNALTNGHSFEVLCMANYTGTIPNQEAKPLSAMKSGGTGLMISNISGARQNELTFLPNVSTSGSSTWRWTTSGIVPKSRTYYHVIGVWNKQEKKSYIYVDGELRKTIDAPGSYVSPTSGATWFCLGGDPANATSAQSGWNGDLVLARIYDKPLEPSEVAALWNEVAEFQANAEPDMITDIRFLSGLAVKAGGYYTIEGKGFAEGDKLNLIPSEQADGGFTVNVETTGGDGVRLQLPARLTTGAYRMVLVRGEKMQDLGQTSFNVVTTMPRGCKVIAHRGYWDIAGAAQNSRRSLQNALDLNIYGSETDVWITADGCMMVNHDATFSGVRIETATAEKAQSLTLSNGEKMPTLKEFLEMMQASDSPTKLIIEIKTHSYASRNLAAADSTVNMVRSMGLQDRVEYIAFSLDICKRLVQNDPSARVAYLNGDISPSQLHEYGITGLDYTAANYRNNPSWVTSAHSLGMTTNVWTINSESEIIEMNNMDIDYVTTNNPEGAAKILRYYEDAQQ